MYKCDKCGKEIERLPIVTDYVPYGDTNVPLDSTDEDCSCGGIFEEAFKCDICGEIKIRTDNKASGYGMCDDCLKKLSKDFDVVRKAYKEDNKSDEAIEYLIDMCSAKSISEVLWEYLISIYKTSSFCEKQITEAMSAYVTYDLADFAERLCERGVIK